MRSHVTTTIALFSRDVGGAASVVVQISMDGRRIVFLQRKYGSDDIISPIPRQTKSVLELLPTKEHWSIGSSSSSTWRLLPSMSETKTSGSLVQIADELELVDKAVNRMNIHAPCFYPNENRFPSRHRRLHRVELNH